MFGRHGAGPFGFPRMMMFGHGHGRGGCGMPFGAWPGAGEGEEGGEEGVEFGGGFGPGGPGGPWFGFGPFRGGPGGPGGPGGGPGARFRRGDIKFALLELIAEKPRHGYDVIKELEARHEGFYKPSPGTVYPTLQMLEEGGSLTSDTVDGKRVYTITDAGRTLLEERAAEKKQQQGGGPRGGPGPFGFAFGGPGGADFRHLGELRASVQELVGAIMQSGRHGPETTEKVREILDRARRDIYSILAE